MKRAVSTVLCLCLAVAFLLGMTAMAGAETSAEELNLITCFWLTTATPFRANPSAF